jgi:nucleotide-binding universal stress UspA family protein
MRVMLAYDGSPDASQAASLAAAIAWPAGSALRVVRVLETTPYPSVWPGGVLVDVPGIDAELVQQAEAMLAAVAGSMSGPGRTVDAVVLHGRPGSALVDEARAFAADLVLVGSRGHGSIAELLLGSVSAELVDHAPCSTLVVRQPGISRILLATDGSPTAALAEGVLGWPIFGGLPVRVISVADVVHPWHTGIAPTMYREVMEAYATDLEAAKVEHRRLADEVAERLRGAGRDASAEVRVGDPATDILAAAADWEADLVILGSRGHTGLTRLILGSVARNVLHGGRASVLIARATAPSEPVPSATGSQGAGT